MQHALLDYKVASFNQRQNVSFAVTEIKRARAVWDPKISRFRCPPGTENGGQVTDRLGSTCGLGIVRRVVNAAIDTAETIGMGIDVAAHARAERRKKRTSMLGKLANGAGKLADFVDPDKPKAPKAKRQKKGSKVAATLAGLGKFTGKLADIIDPDKPGDKKKKRYVSDAFEKLAAGAGKLADWVDPDKPGRRGRRGPVHPNYFHVATTARVPRTPKGTPSGPRIKKVRSVSSPVNPDAELKLKKRLAGRPKRLENFGNKEIGRIQIMSLADLDAEEAKLAKRAKSIDAKLIHARDQVALAKPGTDEWYEARRRVMDLQEQQEKLRITRSLMKVRRDEINSQSANAIDEVVQDAVDGPPTLPDADAMDGIDAGPPSFEVDPVDPNFNDYDVQWWADYIWGYADTDADTTLKNFYNAINDDPDDLHIAQAQAAGVNHPSDPSHWDKVEAKFKDEFDPNTPHPDASTDVDDEVDVPERPLTEPVHPVEGSEGIVFNDDAQKAWEEYFGAPDGDDDDTNLPGGDGDDDTAPTLPGDDDDTDATPSTEDDDTSQPQAQEAPDPNAPDGNGEDEETEQPPDEKVIYEVSPDKQFGGHFDDQESAVKYADELAQFHIGTWFGVLRDDSGDAPTWHVVDYATWLDYDGVDSWLTPESLHGISGFHHLPELAINGNNFGRDLDGALTQAQLDADEQGKTMLVLAVNSLPTSLDDNGLRFVVIDKDDWDAYGEVDGKIASVLNTHTPNTDAPKATDVDVPDVDAPDPDLTDVDTPDVPDVPEVPKADTPDLEQQVLKAKYPNLSFDKPEGDNAFYGAIDDFDNSEDRDWFARDLALANPGKVIHFGKDSDGRLIAGDKERANSLTKVSDLRSISYDPDTDTFKIRRGGQSAMDVTPEPNPYNHSVVDTKYKLSEKPNIGDLAPGMMPYSADADMRAWGGANGDYAVGHHVPKGNLGIRTQDQANERVAEGLDLRHVPTDFLKDALFDNSDAIKGKNARFQTFGVTQGYNSGNDLKSKTVGFLDTVTGQRYIVKTPHRNAQEHLSEFTGQVVMQKLGLPSAGIKFGSDAFLAKDKSGVDEIQRALVIPHVSNYLDGEAVELRDVIHDADFKPDITSLAAMTVLDRFTQNYDRTGGNVIAVKKDDGTWHMQPIDNGTGLVPFSKGNEDAFGYVKPVKGDSITGVQLAMKHYNAEERRQFAVQMARASTKAATTNWVKELSSARDAHDGFTWFEHTKINEHGSFLNSRRKKADQWLNDALEYMGYDEDERLSIINEARAELGLPAKKKPPQWKSTDNAVIAEVEAKFGTPSVAGAKTFTTAIAETHANPNMPQSVQIGSTALGSPNVQVKSVRLQWEGDLDNVIDGTEIQFTLTPQAETELVNMIQSESGEWVTLKGHALPFQQIGHDDDTFRVLRLPSLDEPNLEQHFMFANSKGSVQTHMRKLPDGGVLMYYEGHDSSNYVMRRTVRVFYPSQNTSIAHVENVFDYLGIDKMYAGEEHVRKHLERQAAFTLGFQHLHDPDAVYDDTKLKAALSKAKTYSDISMDDVEPYIDEYGELRARLTDDGLAKLKAKAPNAQVMWKTFGTTETLNLDTKIENFLTQGILSTRERMIQNIVPFAGKSAKDDYATGGAHGLFSHIGPAASYGYDYKFVLDADELLRNLGWWAYPGDTYGAINPLEYHFKGPSFHNFVKNLNDAYEIITPYRISPSMIKRIHLKDHATVQKAILHLKSKGINAINGVPIEQIVVP